MVGLKWDAIDFERGTLTVKRTVTSISVDGKTKIYEQESAKTKSSLRTLTLVGTFREYFSEVKADIDLEETGTAVAETTILDYIDMNPEEYRAYFEEVRNIVFIAIDGTFFEVADFFGFLKLF